MDCIYGSALDVSFACCETEFGDKRVGGRNGCYMLCVAEKEIKGGAGKIGETKEKEESCAEKVKQHKESQE